MTKSAQALGERNSAVPRMHRVRATSVRPAGSSRSAMGARSFQGKASAACSFIGWGFGVSRCRFRSRVRAATPSSSTSGSTTSGCWPSSMARESTSILHCGVTAARPRLCSRRSGAKTGFAGSPRNPLCAGDTRTSLHHVRWGIGWPPSASLLRDDVDSGALALGAAGHHRSGAFPANRYLGHAASIPSGHVGTDSDRRDKWGG